jgi:hypothetical protein
VSQLVYGIHLYSTCLQEIALANCQHAPCVWLGILVGPSCKILLQLTRPIDCCSCTWPHSLSIILMQLSHCDDSFPLVLQSILLLLDFRRRTNTQSSKHTTTLEDKRPALHLGLQLLLVHSHSLGSLAIECKSLSRYIKLHKTHSEGLRHITRVSALLDK